MPFLYLFMYFDRFLYWGPIGNPRVGVPTGAAPGQGVALGIPGYGVPIGEPLGMGFPFGWLQVRASWALGLEDPLALGTPVSLWPLGPP